VVSLRVSDVDWFARAIVTVWVTDAEAYWVSAAFVAVTSQEPAAVGVKVVPATVQSPDTFIYDTSPVPDPPDVVSVRFAPNVAVVLVSESAA
jgi:hypothetical protein